MRGTRFLLIGVVAAIAAGGVRTSAGGQTPLDADTRVVRVEEWLKAVLHHQPGEVDAAAQLVASWPVRDIRMLWVDANALIELTRDPRRGSFTLRGESRGLQPARYTPDQLHRLRMLACAAGGIVYEQECLALKAARELDADLLHLAKLAEASRKAGDDNFVVRRGALLHTDIAMFVPATPEGLVSSAAAGGPQRIRIQTTDGMQVDLGQVAPHWELARALLDHVRPAGATTPAPGLDPMVRLWYRATASWMQIREQHDTKHLDRARAIFPNDADVLFLSGCQHETYAGSPIQTVLQTMYAPIGIKSDVEGERSELHHAESLFRQSIAANPAVPEAHLRYGRVLSLLDRHTDAIPELRVAWTSASDDLLRYYATLFLGAAHEGLRDYAAARDAYSTASQLFPAAQSPRIALSALARRRGDRGGALREMQQLFTRPDRDPENDDPVWKYFVIQGRNTDDLLDQLRRPFRSPPE